MDATELVAALEQLAHDWDGRAFYANARSTYGRELRDVINRFTIQEDNSMPTATRRRSPQSMKKKAPPQRARSQTTTRSQATMRTGGARGAAKSDPHQALLESFEQLETRVAGLERLAGMRPALEHAAGDGGSPKG